MYNSTLCYIEDPKGNYLMLHRVKKKNDLNHDKWVGVGGKFEDGESPELEAAAALVRSRYKNKLAAGRRDLVVAALQRRGFAYAVVKEAIRRAEEE